METIHGMTNGTLNWIQSGPSKREFELRGETGVFGNLKWKKHFGSLATAVTNDGEWTLKRAGFLHPRVSARTAGSNRDIAIFKPGWTGTGTVEFETGLKLSWVNKSFLYSGWAFMNPNGVDILRFQTKPRLLKINVQVIVLSDLPELPLLVCLGMYLLILIHEESTAVSVSMVPVIAST